MNEIQKSFWKGYFVGLALSFTFRLIFDMIFHITNR